jgi:hypothetical protein
VDRNRLADGEGPLVDHVDRLQEIARAHEVAHRLALVVHRLDPARDRDGLRIVRLGQAQVQLLGANQQPRRRARHDLRRPGARHRERAEIVQLIRTCRPRPHRRGPRGCSRRRGTAPRTRSRARCRRPRARRPVRPGPSLITTTLSDIASASAWSWVTKTVVMFEVALDALQLDPHVLAQVGVERRERLVEQQHVGLDHDGAGERDALLLAAGQLAG